MEKYCIKNVQIVDEGRIYNGDVVIKDDRIEKIGANLNINCPEIDGQAYYLIPGLIDDQVHFREPGLTYKADIASESRAALAGGVTSFMEMPNTKPPATSIEALEEKYAIAQSRAWTNYSFFMGAANDNVEEVLKVDRQKVCGVKIFMGSSTGNMLVDNEKVLERYFRELDILVATHCEDEPRVRSNMEKFRIEFGENPDPSIHPLVRDHKACYLSSHFATEMARKHNTRLHVLHLTTAEELALFEKGPLGNKRITSEVCVHHLTYSDKDYEVYGNGIKCNPAVKSESDRSALWKALLEDQIDVIATDHAPHTIEEKAGSYWNAPSGLPLVQHGLTMMLGHYHGGKISIEDIVRKMCHAPAELFDIKDRGYIKEGMKADLVLVDVDRLWVPRKTNIHYKCAWSNLENQRQKGRVLMTWINGKLMYDHGVFNWFSNQAERLQFDRN